MANVDCYSGSCIKILSEPVVACGKSIAVRVNTFQLQDSISCNVLEDLEILLSYSGVVSVCIDGKLDDTKYIENNIDFIAPVSVVIPKGQDYVDFELEIINDIDGIINIESQSSLMDGCDTLDITITCDCLAKANDGLCSDMFFWQEETCSDFFRYSELDVKKL